MYVFFKVSIHVQQTTQLKHYAACLQHGGGGDDRLTTNSRGKRKWTAEGCENELKQLAPRNRKQKKLSNFWKQTFIQVYKYIQPCLSKIYRSWKRKEAKGNWNKTRMRRIKKEECWHRGLLKQKRITKAECKEKEQKRKYKERNEEMIYERRERMKKNMQNTDIKEKDSLYTAESIKISWKLWRIKINANISSTIFYIFILLRIKTFISTNKQAETAFYVNEEGRQES